MRGGINWTSGMLLATFTFCSFIVSANADSELSKDIPARDIENVEVVAQRPVSFYKEEMQAAELEFFTLYNTLTENDDFKIICIRKAVHGFTRLKKRVCEATFISKGIPKAKRKELLNTSKSTELRGDFRSNSNKMKKAALQQKYLGQQLEDMQEKLRTSPELMAKYSLLVSTKAKYEAVK